MSSMRPQEYPTSPPYNLQTRPRGSQNFLQSQIFSNFQLINIRKIYNMSLGRTVKLNTGNTIP
jgi:hypothetical protein